MRLALAASSPASTLRVRVRFAAPCLRHERRGWRSGFFSCVSPSRLHRPPARCACACDLLRHACGMNAAVGDQDAAHAALHAGFSIFMAWSQRRYLAKCFDFRSKCIAVIPCAARHLQPMKPDSRTQRSQKFRRGRKRKPSKMLLNPFAPFAKFLRPLRSAVRISCQPPARLAIPIVLAMMPIITSSAPPPIEARRPSRYRRATRLSSV